jgi:arylsulfatase A-like enzyme
MAGVVFITSDTLRADHLGCYGADHVDTPNLDALAEEAAVFESNYAASYPTVPNRLDVWTGRYNFLRRGWTSLDPDEPTLPGLLTDNGVVTELIYDTPFLGTYNFDRDFSGWERIRGHHSDRWRTDPEVPAEIPAEPYKLKQIPKVEQYLRNRADWRHEREFIAPRTFSAAMDWLERNRTHDDFCLFVDAWDPHEVFDAPDHYIERYDDFEGDEVIYPAYGRPDYMSDDELEHVRARYAAKVTMVDRWTGRLLETIDDLGLRDDVAVIFTSDHGHLFGEHDLQGKPTGSLGRLYVESTRTPLLVRHPDFDTADARIDALTQPPDIMPTILDCFDVPVPDGVAGESLLGLLAGEADGHREHAITARYPEGPEGQAAVFDGWAGPAEVVSPVAVTDGRWYSVCHPDPDRSELYDLRTDPEQADDVREENPEIADDLRRAYVDFVSDGDTDDRMQDPFVSESYTTDSLPADRTLYAFEGERGMTYAHLSRETALRRRPAGTSEAGIRTVTFENLRTDDSATLVYINQQYYRPADLAG